MIWGFKPENIIPEDYIAAGAKLWARNLEIVPFLLDFYQNFYDTKKTPKRKLQGPAAYKLQKLRLDAWIKL